MPYYRPRSFPAPVANFYRVVYIAEPLGDFHLCEQALIECTGGDRMNWSNYNFFFEICERGDPSTKTEEVELII